MYSSFTSELRNKAVALGFPNAKLMVLMEYNPTNSSLAAKLNKTENQVYRIVDIVERGVLVGPTGHLQLIEWVYVRDIL